MTHYIEGFADNISVNHGTTINFKINTDSKSYRIDIYRLGYYGGLGARLMNDASTMTTASRAADSFDECGAGLGRRWKLDDYRLLGGSR